VAAIVEAAARILVDEGPAALTTNGVARRAGVSVGSLYQYFPNKHAVLRALLERELGRAEAIRPALLDDATRPLHERLRAAVDWHLDVHARYPRRREVFAELAASALPARERHRLRRWRQERVRNTVASFDLVPASELDAVALLLDACLGDVADAVAREHPTWLRSELVRRRLTAALVALVECGAVTRRA
jgi:AcrR family transcriptional regulator